MSLLILLTRPDALWENMLAKLTDIQGTNHKEMPDLSGYKYLAPVGYFTKAIPKFSCFVNRRKMFISKTLFLLFLLLVLRHISFCFRDTNEHRISSSTPIIDVQIKNLALRSVGGFPYAKPAAVWHADRPNVWRSNLRRLEGEARRRSISPESGIHLNFIKVETRIRITCLSIGSISRDLGSFYR